MVKRTRSLKRPRITEEQGREMIRMRRQGESIKAIAEAIGCHRQTVRMHLKEKRDDILADEARKEVLKEELLGHFRELSSFAQVGFKLCLDASPLEREKRILKGTRERGPIFLEGLLGLPSLGSSTFMSNEWMRMYNPSPKDEYMMKSLREHTKGSSVWTYWDNWRKKVAGYESTSREVLDWVKTVTETELFDISDLTQVHRMQVWLFGNILRVTNNAEAEKLEISGARLVTPVAEAELVVKTEVNLVVAQATDEASTRRLHDYLYVMLQKAQQQPQQSRLRSSTAELSRKETQLELRDMAREIDAALISIELMRAFPGRCSLCPV
jgi:transposase-like protein